MSAQSDSTYFEMRSAAEWRAAKRAQDTSASVIHAKLARHYEARAASAKTEESLVCVGGTASDAA